MYNRIKSSCTQDVYSCFSMFFHVIPTYLLQCTPKVVYPRNLPFLFWVLTDSQAASGKKRTKAETPNHREGRACRKKSSSFSRVFRKCKWLRKGVVQQSTNEHLNSWFELVIKKKNEPYHATALKESEHLHRTKAGEAFLQLCLCCKGIQMGHEESSWSTFLPEIGWKGTFTRVTFCFNMVL